MYELKGLLKVKNETQQVSDKFKKREFVITDNSSQYPQQILFQLTQDRCGLLDGFNEGEELKVNFNIRGREWTSPSGDVKYFVSLDVWRIEKEATAPIANTPPPVSEEPFTGNTAASTDSFIDSVDDDLPF